MHIFLFGLFAGLGFPPTYLIIFLPIGFYKLLQTLAASKDAKSSFYAGLSFGFGYFLTQLYWISHSLFVDIKTYIWLFPFALCLIPLCCAIFIACATLCTHIVVRAYTIRNKFLITVIFSALYVVFELIRGIIFPWNLFAYTLGFSDILPQILCILDIYVLDFILILFCCGMYVLCNTKDIKYYLYYLLLPFFLYTFGLVRLHNATPKRLDKNIMLVQANIPQQLKWNKNELDKNLDKHFKLSMSKDDFAKTDIIIWAESSIPYPIDTNLVLDKKFSQLKDKILISGAVRIERENHMIKHVWNSILFIQNGKLLDFYDKTTLVPFGEYIPNFIPFAKKFTNGSINFSKGVGNKTININGIKISPLICYEIMFPHKIINKNNPPDVIINITNDAWFGNTSGPYQHATAARFRAIENKIPLIRVANSGITFYADEYGRIKTENIIKIAEKGVILIR